ncbi:4ee8cb6d-d640-4aae-8a6a-4a31664639c9 [Sclerotinia trifoliorum]|uniref:4ee8cb6d-d640-4aae-8a6a-4a31664639c9 n=1 Tax=Sclerotinia trifoliorum TaxID=28548 RepID=A0A8H2VUW4_9HELO|nr:4ee8cb6d-d640-4aae-8a6a-4a31664639c9 [Sclerotinia trifoliorum]
METMISFRAKQKTGRLQSLAAVSRAKEKGSPSLLLSIPQLVLVIEQGQELALNAFMEGQRSIAHSPFFQSFKTEGNLELPRGRSRRAAMTMNSFAGGPVDLISYH